MMVTFDAATKRILDGKHFATVATLNPGGAPQTSLVWYQREGDTVVFTTTTTRQKGRNLARDPRISFGVFDPAHPYDYVEIRGKVELTEDPDKRLSKFLSQKYMNEDPPAEPADVIRLVVRVIPEKVVHFTA
jgi:PPOX class probable F420-dependent enzyme